MEKMWRLCVLDVWLDHADVVRNVTVGGEDVKQPIQIVIKKENRKGERLRRHFADARVGRFIGKQTGAVVAIQRHTLVGEIADDYPLPPGAIVIACVDAHPCTRSAGFAECHTCYT